MKAKFINQSERYGEQVEATISDYQSLCPDGKFKIVGNTIVENLENGNTEIIAVAK